MEGNKTPAIPAAQPTILFLSSTHPLVHLPAVKIFVAILTMLQLHAGAETADSLLAGADRAMDSGLWDVAAIKLEEAVGQSTLPSETQARALMLLAEGLVRGNQPDRALAILDDSLISESPRAAFWRGQALAGKGRYSDAVETLLPLARDPIHPLRAEAALTAASLLLSLSKPDEALEILARLEDSTDPGTTARSRLRRIEILIDNEQFAAARALLPPPEEITERLEPLATFLEGLVALAERKPKTAEALFSALLATPANQSKIRYNQAALGKADSLAAQGKTDEATLSLLTFIQENPTAPLLEGMFRRLIDWFPKTIVSPDDPTLVRLSSWLPQTTPVGTGPLNDLSITGPATLPSPTREISDLSAFALHARAIGLRHVNTPTARSEAELLLRRLRLLAPRHFLAQRSLLLSGKWKAEDGDEQSAARIFNVVRETATSPPVRGEAAFLAAGIAYENRDPSLAAELFQEAASFLSDENREAAILNSALARLNQDPGAKILIIAEDETSPTEATQLNADLALERALLSESPAAARSALDAFLTAHPDHPRAAEARLAMAEAALASTPPDLSLARAQLDTLAASTSSPPPTLSSRFALARLQIADLAGDTENTVATARRLIETFPESPEASKASLILGKSLFQTGDYNEARLVLVKLAAGEPGSQRSQAALLIAARSAALGATTQSREEALDLFDRTIAIDGPLKSLARLEKARLNIDLNRLPTAIASLTEAYEATAPDDPARVPTGLLLGEAIYAQGDSDPESLGKALAIYNDLIILSANNPTQYFRLQYLRGLTLEKIPSPDDPSTTRLGEALSAYFSVLDRPTDPPPAEWEWFERSGFRALALLENAERWQAAVSIAEKIALFKGPRAEEASTRARQLRLKHMIWED